MEEPGGNVQCECYGWVGIAGTILATFLSTCLILALAALAYRNWKRNKGKHLVLVTDPEIVEEAYAFDNPCFKDVTPAVGRSLERSNVLHAHNAENQTGKEGSKWSTPWSNLHIGRSNEKRRTLDDSCVGKAGRVSVVSLRSRDFTGLGFNVCGNMREGIFVKDLLHRGPASESGRIHPGDRITSVKISFRSMVYEDALTILSYASPYDVEIEVESGSIPETKPTSLLKKSISPSPGHLYHPLYRSQSIPELLAKPQPQSNGRKYTSRRLFDQNNQSLNDSTYSNSTLKSRNSIASSGTPQGSYSNVELRIGSGGGSRPTSGVQLAKFGIKVLPALDGTVHRVETQNEHNTNLERRHSKKQLEGADGKAGGFGGQQTATNGVVVSAVDGGKMEKEGRKRDVERENLQQRARVMTEVNGIDVPDRASEIVKEEKTSSNVSIPSEVPAEVHNAAVAARRNRKSAHIEMMDIPKEPQQETQSQPVQESMDASGAKSPSKGKRKAPAPPSRTSSEEISIEDKTVADDKAMNGISDLKEDEKPITTHEDMFEKMTMGKQLESEKRTSMDEPISPKESKPPTESSPIKKRSSAPTTNDRRVSESDTDSEIQNSFRTIELKPADITVHRTPVPDDSKPPPIDHDDDDDDEIYRKAASLGDLSRYEAATAAAKSSSSTLERAQSLDMTDSSSKSKRKAPLVPAAEDILAESTEDLTKLDQLDASRSKLKKSSEWGTLEDAIWISPDSHKQKSSQDSPADDSINTTTTTTTMEENEDEDEEDDEEVETSIELYNLPLSKKLTQDFLKAERLFDVEEDNSLLRIVNDGRVLKSPTPELVEAEFLEAHPPPDYDDDDEEEVEEIEEMEMELEDEPRVIDDEQADDDAFERAIRYFEAHSSSPKKSSTTKIQLSEPPEELYAGKKEVAEEPANKVHVEFDHPCEHHHHEKHSHPGSPTPPTNTTDPKSSEKDTEVKEKESDLSYHRTIRVQSPFETHHAKPVMSSLPEPNEPQTPSKTYVTEIRVSSTDDQQMEETSPKGVQVVTPNGKLPAGKKPPVPPRRSDASRYLPASSGDRQVVYVSDFKPTQDKQPSPGKQFDNWIFMKDSSDKERKSWTQANQSSVTNIVLQSGHGDDRPAGN